MNDFIGQMREEQILWRKKYLSNQEPGDFRGKLYDFVIPEEEWHLNLWTEIREPLVNYLKVNGVQRHDGSHHLLSSWTLCANLYYPFSLSKNSLELMGSFLKSKVSDSVKEVRAIELEFALPDDLNQGVLLGEKGGSRGANQTSPDVAFVVETEDSKKGLILTEVKLTEHSFYDCSGYSKTSGRHPNPDISRCLNAGHVINDVKGQCHLTVWGRRYWDHLESIVDKNEFSKLKKCIACEGGYQLFRQQALAEGIISSSTEFGLVTSCLACDERNSDLLSCMEKNGISDIENQWSTIFKGKSGFSVFHHRDWVNWVREHDSTGEYKNWIDYVHNRYGY